MTLTLRQVFLLTIAGLTVLLGLLFYLLFAGSQRSILKSSDHLREEAAQRVAADFQNYLQSAEKELSDVEGTLRVGAVSPDDPAGVEGMLYAAVHNNPRLAELTVTHADKLEYRPNGRLDHAAGDRWQISAFRSLAPPYQVMTRRVVRTGEGPDEKFTAETRSRDADRFTPDERPTRRDPNAADPTEHPTFRTLVNERFFPPGPAGETLWSDLQNALDLDATSPDARPSDARPSDAGPATGPATRPATSPAAPAAAATGPAAGTAAGPDCPTSFPAPAVRVEVTVQRAVRLPGRSADPFVAVIRVGLTTTQLDEMCGLHRVMAAAADGEADPHRAFVCDAQGRLITRVAPDDRVEEVGDDLRVVSPHPPPEIAAALKLPVLATLKPGEPQTGMVTAGGQRYLVTFRQLDGNQDWIVGVIAPEAFYLRGLSETRNRLLVASLAVILVILAGGVMTLRVVQRGLNRVTTSARRMQDFDFAPSDTRGRFRDVRSVLEGIETAKTAMRAMGKYVPVGLVRQLYLMNSEPRLGGDPSDVTLMFTDIAGFTSIAEKVPAADLGVLLGDYFGALTAAVHRNHGMVDKFIGDAVMALWNVPTPVDNHPAHACRAALECLAASGRLGAAAAALGLPPFTTRIGLHRDTVLVGHFGAPDRMGYTALGDGVNLAARLEGLNKQYGTRVIVTDAVRDAAGDEFTFRLLDRVVVKGKTQVVRVYELRGPSAAPDPAAEVVRGYEQAMEWYRDREFEKAEAAFAAQAAADPPSRILADRCRVLAAYPPGDDWDGVYVARSK